MSCVTKITPRIELALQLADQEQHLNLHGRVERVGRLVGQQQTRIARQRERDHGALAHAARHLVRIGLQPLRPARGCAPSPGSSLARLPGLRSDLPVWRLMVSAI
jgi:hypothetical protein